MHTSDESRVQNVQKWLTPQIVGKIHDMADF